jgi:single-stranded DNA-binding protein
MPGLLRGIARTAVVAGTASSVAGRVRHRQEGKWAQQEEAQEPQQQQQQQQQYAPPPPAPAAPPVDPIQKLKDLADLKQQGILTDEEFAAQKAKILAA